jgi:hypothetical protein
MAPSYSSPRYGEWQKWISFAIWAFIKEEVTVVSITTLNLRLVRTMDLSCG